MNIIEIHNLIENLEVFFSDDSKPIFRIGEIVGSNLLRYVIEAATTRFDIHKILFIEGIQDDMYNGKLLPNHLFWGSIFTDIMIDGIIPYDIYKPRIQNPDIEYSKQLMTLLIAPFDCIIINQAHMIPSAFLDTITNTFGGKIVLIVDPFDFNGIWWFNTTTCVDSFDKLPRNIAYARYLHGIDTRVINKHSKLSIEYGINIAKRSIGRIDEKQYVMKDPDLRMLIQNKQRNVNFRKNQKVLVTDNRMTIKNDTKNGVTHALCKGALLHIERASNVYQNIRLHGSTFQTIISMSYVYDRFRTPSNFIQVEPANIISIPDAMNHRFRHIVYVATSDYPDLSITEQYAMIKRCQSFSIANTK